MNLDYIAGFFDGEGCILARTRTNKGNRGNRETWWFRVTITQKNTEVLDEIQTYLNEKHGFHFKMTRINSKDAAFIYIDRVDEVEKFLKLMLSRLIVKWYAALVALEAIENRPRKGERAKETWAKKGARLK